MILFLLGRVERNSPQTLDHTTVINITFLDTDNVDIQLPLMAMTLMVFSECVFLRLITQFKPCLSV